MIFFNFMVTLWTSYGQVRLMLFFAINLFIVFVVTLNTFQCPFVHSRVFFFKDFCFTLFNNFRPLMSCIKKLLPVVSKKRLSKCCEIQGTLSDFCLGQVYGFFKHSYDGNWTERCSRFLKASFSLRNTS